MIRVRRKTKYENRYHPKMGRIKTRVTRVYQTLFGVIPIKKLHHYRGTYYGEVKDVSECKLGR